MKLSKNLAFPLLTTIFAIGIAASAGASEGTFDELDTDQDGVISQSEAQAHATLSATFAEVDTDADGVISWAEFSAAGLDQ
ncbi:EF-hand domain-containing protein [Ningiella sp. W23]|uniref:EF-hand domain-containing protein n=1 Tax=Ningiella sp. W23 TaxID=3023715 RepID=UPI003756EDEE